ncbi:martik isoform 1-T6 [Glossina fuscipes fuscipes]
MLLTRLKQPSSSNTYPPLFKGSVGKSFKKFSSLKMSQAGQTNKLPLASTNGTTMANDSNALLTPIHNTRSTDKSNRPEKRRLGIERNLWRSDEVMCMLKTMQKTKALELLNDKTVKSEKVFKDVEEIMFSSGYRKKSHLQIWTKWKFLKSTYMTSRRTGIMPRMVCSEIYSELHKMLNNRSGANGMLSDCGNSTTGSMDDDVSNVGSSSIIISGVEGGVSTIRGSDEADVADERDDRLDIAHPIFGFRLGLVKPEPADTGYETVENNGSVSDKDPLEEPAANGNLHKSSSVQVKQEIEEDSTELETEENITAPTTESILLNKQPIRFVQTPKATSTPNSTANECPTPPLIPLAKLPPLRVAPFAKTVDIKANNMPNRPPPPLTMPPTPRPIHVTSLSNLNETSKLGGIIKFSHPNVMQNFSGSSQQIRTPIRISKEITIHSRNSNASASSSFPKLKQVPMRKTPYSLRPDRAIPDLDDSTSPPASEASSCSQRRLDDVPSSSQLSMQGREESSHSKSSFNNMKKKRRLDWQPENPMAVKMPKIQSAYSQRKPVPDDSEEEEQNVKSNNKQTEEEKYEKLLNHVVQEVSTSLRDMQKEMMHSFLKTQQQLIRQEHEFQMQQDLMLMKAFQDQTRNIMRTVNKLWSTKPTTQQQTTLDEKKIVKNSKEKCKKPNDTNSESVEEHFEDQANPEDDVFMPESDEDESQGHIEMYLRNGLEGGEEKKQLNNVNNNSKVEAGVDQEVKEEANKNDGKNQVKQSDPSNHIQDGKGATK